MPSPSVHLPAPVHRPTVEVNSHPVVPLQTKCHQYWPDPPDVAEHGNFHIRCQSEDCTIAYVFREMLVTNTEVSSAPAVSGRGGPLFRGRRSVSILCGPCRAVLPRLLRVLTW